MLDSTLPEKRTALAKWETEMIERARNNDTRVAENLGSTLGRMGSVAGWAGKEQRSATPRSLTGWVGGDNQTERAATKPDSQGGVWQ